MDYEIEVITIEGVRVVTVNAPNQRDAHLLAAIIKPIDGLSSRVW